MDYRKLYEQDEFAWRDKMIELLEQGNLNEIDSVNLRVVLIEMGKSEQRSVKSNLTELILHLLKAMYQPELASRSWLVSIQKQRLALKDSFEDSPSLLNVARNNFEPCYRQGRKFALSETGLDHSEIPESAQFDFDYVIGDELPKSLQT